MHEYLDPDEPAKKRYHTRQEAEVFARAQLGNVDDIVSY